MGAALRRLLVQRCRGRRGAGPQTVSEPRLCALPSYLSPNAHPILLHVSSNSCANLSRLPPTSVRPTINRHSAAAVAGLKLVQQTFFPPRGVIEEAREINRKTKRAVGHGGKG